MNLFREKQSPLDTVERWPHQIEGVRAVIDLIERGIRKIVLTSPTGGGKTLMIADLIRWAVSIGWGVTIFSNRKLMIEQLGNKLDEYGIEYGWRRAGHPTNGHEPVQLASVQTEHSRVVKRQSWRPSQSGLAIVDEAHLFNNKRDRAVISRYTDNGAFVVGVTATPLNLGGEYNELVIAGTTSELRACGALVIAEMYGCDEPDLTRIRRYAVGEEISEDDNRKIIMVPGIHGRVLDNYRRLNPHGLPAIGFAPGVAESVGFAEAFQEAGIDAAHIDGERIWVKGSEYISTEERRAELLQMSRNGEVRIIWNRFVLREAIDMPWLRHGILACVFGSVQSYLQSGGRLLRACDSTGKRSVCVQDHGGNWWRHGSLNIDRNWRLSDTSRTVANERNDGIAGDSETASTEPEPFLCPACKRVMVLRNLMDGTQATCPGCGNVVDFRRRSRPVIQFDGNLIEYPGPIFKARNVERRPDTTEKWKSIYWRAKKSRMTFTQAAGLFYQENGYFPPRTLQMMPRLSWHWYLPVPQVAFHELLSEGEASEKVPIRPVS